MQRREKRQRKKQRLREKRVGTERKDAGDDGPDRILRGCNKEEAGARMGEYDVVSVLVSASHCAAQALSISRRRLSFNLEWFTPMHAVVLWCFFCFRGVGGDDLFPQGFRVSSLELPTLRGIVGDYDIDGAEEGIPRYRKTDGSHVILRNARGTWCFASEGKVGHRKTLVVSTRAGAASPSGLSFKRYAGDGVWEVDPSFRVRDVSAEVAERKAEERRLTAAVDRAESEAELMTALAAREKAAKAAAKAATKAANKAAAGVAAAEQRRVAEAAAAEKRRVGALAEATVAHRTKKRLLSFFAALQGSRCLDETATTHLPRWF